MTASESHPWLRHVTARDAIAGGSLEILAGAAAVGLAVLGLAGAAPAATAAIAAIALAGALVGHGIAVADRRTAVAARRDEEAGETHEHAKLGEAAADEVLAGTFSVAFGVLALIGIEPVLLLGVTAIACGGTLVLAGPSRRLEFALPRAPLVAFAAAAIVAGLGATALGVIALFGVPHALVLVLVALLAVGVVMLASGWIELAGARRAES